MAGAGSGPGSLPGGCAACPAARGAPARRARPGKARRVSVVVLCPSVGAAGWELPEVLGEERLAWVVPGGPLGCLQSTCLPACLSQAEVLLSAQSRRRETLEHPPYPTFYRSEIKRKL